jgi:hypothetical protein
MPLGEHLGILLDDHAVVLFCWLAIVHQVSAPLSLSMGALTPFRPRTESVPYPNTWMVAQMPDRGDLARAPAGARR